jgi:hypothetical protein
MATFEKSSHAPFEYDSSSEDITSSADVYDSSRVDPILARKMALVNAAIDEIGMTPFQWKLFFFNGFGYAVDSVSHIHELRFYFHGWITEFRHSS